MTTQRWDNAIFLVFYTWWQHSISLTSNVKYLSSYFATFLSGFLESTTNFQLVKFSYKNKFWMESLVGMAVK